MKHYSKRYLISTVSFILLVGGHLLEGKVAMLLNKTSFPATNVKIVLVPMLKGRKGAHRYGWIAFKTPVTFDPGTIAAGSAYPFPLEKPAVLVNGAYRERSYPDSHVTQIDATVNGKPVSYRAEAKGDPANTPYFFTINMSGDNPRIDSANH